MPAWVRERRNDTVQHRKKPSQETYELLNEDFDDFDETAEFDGKSTGKPTRSFLSEKMQILARIIVTAADASCKI